MDSINQNQPEENRRDLAGADAVSRIQQTVKDADTCFFVPARRWGRPPARAR